MPITRPSKTDSESEEASDEGDEEGEIFKEQDDDEAVPMDVDENAAPPNQTPKDPNGRLNIFQTSRLKLNIPFSCSRVS